MVQDMFYFISLSAAAHNGRGKGEGGGERAVPQTLSLAFPLFIIIMAHIRRMCAVPDDHT